MPDPIADIFGAAAGKTIPGGCDECDAEQNLDEVAPGVWALVVGHEDGCPFLRSRKAASN